MGKRFPDCSFAHNFSCVDRGRILIFWNNATVGVDTLDMDDQLLHASIKCLISGRQFLLTCIYGLHSIQHRKPLWDKLKMVGQQQINLPWIILGDFNSVLTPDEKHGGLLVTNREIRDLSDCVAFLELYDTQHVGCFYTWSNNTVHSKIDRVMINSVWMQHGLDIYTEFLPPGCISDHSLSITTVFRENRRRNIPFKFYNMWAAHNLF
ncbi:hypothetical protein F511_13897 [Dorcoceras hygrometricum]|uniref:Endonuclease/exonuclease/phosphatase domain-containing protein n=1 Tax=Dorcoceras hygrometricum TaxID=472368 RepID=A0A2Z7DFT8_9LAMI|nr:hypothetical protein F511_13897 [Dorcoceras hygrometricum]